MVARSRVAAYANVPVARPALARAGRSLIQRRNQCDYVLLIQGPSTERAYCDVERTVLPEHIVRQNWVRVLPASSIVRRGARIVACRAGDSRGEVRNQRRAVLDAYQAGRVVRRRRDPGVWRARGVRSRHVITGQ